MRCTEHKALAPSAPKLHGFRGMFVVRPLRAALGDTIEPRLVAPTRDGLRHDVRSSAQRVLGMLEIRNRIVRCTARESLDVRDIHDRFVKLADHRASNQSIRPAVVIVRRIDRAMFGRPGPATAPLNTMSYFSNGSMVRL